VRDQESFCFTYGDGVADIDIGKQIAFHKQHGRWATVTAVQPPGRYGALLRDKNSVSGFQEKPPGDGAWINGGFFILNPKVIDFIEGDNSSWEGTPLETIALKGQLQAYEHKGFWQPMDTLRDKNHLEELWLANNAPWKTW
jgi:glucose-1-phosphate cytidylyltransferase